MPGTTISGSIPELMAQNFPHGEAIQQALQMLALRLSQGMEQGTTSTLVFIIEREDGNGMMIITKDGKPIDQPLSFAMAVDEVAEKGRRFALAMAQR